jgi:hypothetical protein
MIKKLVLTLALFFLTLQAFTQLVTPPVAQAQNSCREVFYNEGEEVPETDNVNVFDTMEACIANAGEFGCYYRDSSGTCTPKSPTDCQYIRAGGGITFESAGACALNEAPGERCYTRNSSTGVCTMRTADQCEIVRDQGQETYDSETECVNQGQATGSCYIKNSGICTAINADLCRQYRQIEGDPFETLDACLQSSVDNTKPLACASEADCPGEETVCNTTTFRCEAKSTAVANGSACNSATAYTPTGTGTTGAICCVGGATECANNYSCSGSGNNTFGSCQPSSSGTGGTTSPNQSSATGTGSCAACLGLGGQAERDCYAQCSGTIQTGICAGMTAAQCQAACSQAGATTQICSGAQEGAGTPRAGEFLSCGVSSTNGCGQVDCINSSGTLIGFVIDTSSCSTPDNQTPSTPTTTTPTTTKPKPSPTLSPDLAACGEACVSDNNCADANHECSEGVCRLKSNPTSPTCTDPEGETPTPTPQPSPTPVPSPNPELAGCNESCDAHSDCADLLHSCQGGVCRLTSNPGNAECKTPTNTTPPTVPRTPSTPLQCNDPCTSNSQCSSFNHVCHNGTCRLSTNLDNVSCTSAVIYQSSSTQLGQISQQPDSPTALPSAGAEDFAAWIMTGIGALAVGAVILLLL